MKDEIDIAFCASDNFEKVAAVAAMSVMENTKSPLCFHIFFTSSYTDDAIAMDFWVRMAESRGHRAQFIRCEAKTLMFGRLPNGWHWNRTHFLKLGIAEWAPDLNRVLYLDADVIANGDVAELWNMDLGGRPLGARYVKEEGGNPAHFNSGVMLMDCDAWRQRRVMDAVVDIARRNNPGDFKLYCADQTPLNQYFGNDYVDIGPAYNAMPLLEQISENAKIIHFCGDFDRTPWKERDSDAAQLWWEYCEKTPFKKFFDGTYQTWLKYRGQVSYNGLKLPEGL